MNNQNLTRWFYLLP